MAPVFARLIADAFNISMEKDTATNKRCSKGCTNPRNCPEIPLLLATNKVIRKRTKLLIPNDLDSAYTNFNMRARKVPSLPSFSSQSEQ